MSQHILQHIIVAYTTATCYAHSRGESVCLGIDIGKKSPNAFIAEMIVGATEHDEFCRNEASYRERQGYPQNNAPNAIKALVAALPTMCTGPFGWEFGNASVFFPDIEYVES